MNISVICVGKLKEDYLKSAIAEYSKRLSRFSAFEIIEVPDQKIPDNAGEKLEEQILIKEGETILSKIKNNSYVVAMCIEGKQLSSEELANEIKNISMTNSNITFIIGGSLGLSKAVKQRADKCISFGKITLPHQLMRVVLSEQIYRAFKINSNEAYHK
ncbi:MAG: 23S rRNA (pseudouridine(1915)-N(3))-methyltransferase RlmH [Clostridia bacterium]|nr:23S rRNA (pseudouridine(1915)-N(3))-methyltransferase RlmH [Clostridia bacterium]